MKPSSAPTPKRRLMRMHGARARESGIILFITMIALLILMISGIALVRSFDASQLHSGNIALKRDTVNQGERAIAAALAKFGTSGALASDTVRQANSTANNYSATTLSSDSHGIPLVLTGSSSWTMGTTNDITDSVSGANIRYVIDRMCNGTGTETAANCVSYTPTVAGTATGVQNATISGLEIIYRISVRVTMNNNTQTFLQTTILM